jgi:hypothetical protein
MITDPFLKQIVKESGRREITTSMIAQANANRRTCKCENIQFIQARIGGLCGRIVIEEASASDAKHQINSMGNLAYNNAYGLVGSYCPDCERTLPVICGHGGSMWLCRGCAKGLIEWTAEDVVQK